MNLEDFLVGHVVMVYPSIEGLLLVYADGHEVLISVDDEGDFVFRERKVPEC